MEVVNLASTHHPTNNINSIVMQTSPAKFFQGTTSTGQNLTFSSAKKTMEMMRGFCGATNAVTPEQPVLNFNQFQGQSSNMASLRISGATSINDAV